MASMRSIVIKSLASTALVLSSVSVAVAQDMLPADNGLTNYHTSPRYRESESHPLRVLAYVVHPIGWLAREVIFRPLSYFASSTETSRSIMGYREPFDYRQPECFTADDSTPDCRSIMPFNYEQETVGDAETEPAVAPAAVVAPAARQVYFPDVAFDFNKRQLNELGMGRVHQISDMLKSGAAVSVVLQGHADSVGSDAYNEKLGLDRAEAVRAELVNLGTDASKLSTVTFGETKPVYSEESGWARAVNRRVEVHAGE